MTDHEALDEEALLALANQVPGHTARELARRVALLIAEVRRLRERIPLIAAEAKQQQRDADRLTVHVIRFDKDERKAGGPDNFYNGVLHAEVALAAAPLIGEDKP